MAKNKKTRTRRNTSKCKILTTKKNKPLDPINLLINNTKIPTVKVFKDLGIYISEILKWNEHINYLYNVAKVSSNQISKSFKTNSATILTNLFKIYVCPMLEYNTQIWSPY